jgi:hypothetical protein
MVFLLIVNTLTTPKRLEQMAWLILVCCSCVAFRAVFDYARGINLVENGRVQGAVSGIFGNPTTSRSTWSPSSGGPDVRAAAIPQPGWPPALPS